MTAISRTSIRSVRSSRRSNKGFTLVEILIVVIILGILAAIVIPQFTNASTDARKSNMASQDQTCKSQISLYALQHNDTYPTLINSGATDWSQLTSLTDVTGAITTTATPGKTFGPYLQAAPVNPLQASSTVIAVPAGGLGASVAAGTGWVYNGTTGEFHGVTNGTSPTVSDDGN